MKTNKKLLLLTSMVILFPMLWGLMIWSQLPNQIPIHFNFAGQPNNFQSKPLVVFGLPIFDLMVHLFMIIFSFIALFLESRPIIKITNRCTMRSKIGRPNTTRGFDWKLLAWPAKLK